LAVELEPRAAEVIWEGEAPAEPSVFAQSPPTERTRCRVSARASPTGA
jgi:hypothetical protein